MPSVRMTYSKILFLGDAIKFSKRPEHSHRVFFSFQKMEDLIAARLGEFDPGYVDTILSSVLAGMRPHCEPD